jgi:hypothetical protein
MLAKICAKQGAPMHWTDDDGDDVGDAIARLQSAAASLAGDLERKRARPGTRAALDAAMSALLALDDVYFEDDAGQPVPEAWARARHLLRKA